MKFEQANTYTIHLWHGISLKNNLNNMKEITHDLNSKP